MTNFYEGKDVNRHTVVISESYKKKLKAVAKNYHLTQGEVIEVLLDQMNLAQIGGHFEARRKQKEGGRTTQKDVIDALKGLTPEQLKAVEEAIERTKVQAA